MSESKLRCMWCGQHQEKADDWCWNRHHRWITIPDSYAETFDRAHGADAPYRRVLSQSGEVWPEIIETE